MSLETQVQSRLAPVLPGKVFAVFAPAGTTGDKIVWQTISSVPENSHDATADLYQSRVQVTAYSATLAQARTLRNSCVAALEGNHSDGPIMVVDKSENYETEAAIYRADADFYVWANN